VLPFTALFAHCALHSNIREKKGLARWVKSFPAPLHPKPSWSTSDQTLEIAPARGEVFKAPAEARLAATRSAVQQVEASLTAALEAGATAHTKLLAADRDSDLDLRKAEFCRPSNTELAAALPVLARRTGAILCPLSGSGSQEPHAAPALVLASGSARHSRISRRLHGHDEGPCAAHPRRR
jgi:hypothetical protein